MEFVALWKQLHCSECGQDLIEYALVIAAVLAAIVAGSNNIATLLTCGLAAVQSKISNAVS
jgi:Flp pilus assembly pilin Flp